MKRQLSLFLATLCAASLSMAQANLWNATTNSPSGAYDGAFGTGSETNAPWSDLSTSTSISTVNGSPGYLLLRNQASTTVDINDSFQGFVGADFAGSGTFTVDINADGSSVSGANMSQSGAFEALHYDGGDLANHQSSLNVTGGTFSGGSNRDGMRIRHLNNLLIDGSSAVGGNGGSGPSSQGGTAINIHNVNNATVSSTESIQGGNSAGATPSVMAGPASSIGGDGISFNRNYLPGATVPPPPPGTILFSDDFADTKQNLTIDVERVSGGNSGGATGNTASGATATGGNGLAVNGANLTLNSGQFYGGNGGGISGGIISGNADGGTGILLGEDVTVTSIDASVMAVGGDAGSVSGSAPSGYALNAVSARGGDGLSLVDVTGSDTLAITDGTFMGGKGGGISINTNANFITVDGGDGARLVNVGTVTVANGSFSGGAAGSAAGVDAKDGVGLGLYDVSNTIINNGQFAGTKGLQLNALTRAASLTVNGGSFSAVEFNAEGANTTVNLNGGNFTDMTFDGANTQTVSFDPSMTVSGTILQDSGGNVNITGGADNQFMNVVVTNGNMQINRATATLLGGSSFVLNNMDQIANATFSGDLTASGYLEIGRGTVQANTVTLQGSSLLTTYDNMQFGLLAANNGITINDTTWAVRGTGAITADFLLARTTGSTIDTNGLSLIDFTFIGDEWLDGITNVVLQSANRELWAQYGPLPLALAAGVENPNSDYAHALYELDAINGYPGSHPYGGIYGTLRAETDHVSGPQTLWSNYGQGPEVSTVLLRQQGVFAEQLKERSRSFVNYSTYQHGDIMGANGPEMVNEYLPNIDPRRPMNHVQDYYPGGETARNPENAVRRGFQGLDQHMPKPGSEEMYVAAGDGGRVPAPVKSEDNMWTGLVTWFNDLGPDGGDKRKDVDHGWNAWARGYGANLGQDQQDGLKGYDANMGGGIVGLDRRFSKLIAGLGAGYAHTLIHGQNEHEAVSDSLYGTLYTTLNFDGFFIDLNANLAWHGTETDGEPILAYEGEFDSSTYGFYLGMGKGIGIFHDKFLLTPEVSVLAAMYSQEAYDETSKVAGASTKHWQEYDTSWVTAEAGFTLSYLAKIDNFNLDMAFTPEVRAHYIHEAKMSDEFDNSVAQGTVGPQYSLVNGSTYRTVLHPRDENLLKLGGGVKFHKWDNHKLELGLDLDGIFAGSYEEYMLSAKLLHRF